MIMMIGAPTVQWHCIHNAVIEERIFKAEFTQLSPEISPLCHTAKNLPEIRVTFHGLLQSDAESELADVRIRMKQVSLSLARSVLWAGGLSQSGQKRESSHSLLPPLPPTTFAFLTLGCRKT